jgi:hypothetical protein
MIQSSVRVCVTVQGVFYSAGRVLQHRARASGLCSPGLLLWIIQLLKLLDTYLQHHLHHLHLPSTRLLLLGRLNFETF